MSQTASTLEQTQVAIAALLRDLESHTGHLVSGLHLDTIEITGLHLSQPQHRMQVVIDPAPPARPPVVAP